MAMYISKESKVLFYDYICEFEESISSNFGRYDFQNANLQRYLLNANIYIASGFGSANLKRARASRQYILFDNTKPSAISLANINNDFVHNLLRHIRNSMAHGNLGRETPRNAFYRLKDYNKNGSITMDGYILVSDFEPLLNLLKNSIR